MHCPVCKERDSIITKEKLLQSALSLKTLFIRRRSCVLSPSNKLRNDNNFWNKRWTFPEYRNEKMSVILVSNQGQLCCHIWSNFKCCCRLTTHSRATVYLHENEPDFLFSFFLCCNGFHCVKFRYHTFLIGKNTLICPQAFRNSPKYPRHLSIIQGRQFRRTHELPLTVSSRQASHGCGGKHHLCIGWCRGVGRESHELGTKTSVLVDQGGTFQGIKRTDNKPWPLCRKDCGSSL